MTGDIPPPTRKTLEEQIALFVGALLAVVSSLIDATPLSSTARTCLHAAFANLFARFEAHFIAMLYEARAQLAQKQLDATTEAAPPATQTTPTRRPRTKTTPIPSAPALTSAPAPESPAESLFAEAPHQMRAPAPTHPTRAPHRAVTPSTIFTIPNRQNFQKTAYTPCIYTPKSLLYRNKMSQTYDNTNLSGPPRHRDEHLRRSNPSGHNPACP